MQCCLGQALLHYASGMAQFRLLLARKRSCGCVIFCSGQSAPPLLRLRVYSEKQLLQLLRARAVHCRSRSI